MKGADVAFAGLVIAIVGGDGRDREVARLAAAAGAAVRGYGFPWPENGVAGVQHAGSAAEALEGADYAVFPVAGMAADGSLYAPSAPGPIVPGPGLLGRLKPGAMVVLGRATEGLREAAGAVGVALEEYEDDAELMLLRAPAIAEGVVALAITNTEVTVHGSAVGVVGYGKVGTVLARTLVALGARVHVFARAPAQRAGAYTAGCRAHPLGELPGRAGGLAMLFSTVPAPVVGRDVLAALAPGALVVDLAAPPGGVDLAAAGQLGHRAIWARGMGASAPVTVAASQWAGIARRISDQEERKMAGDGKTAKDIGKKGIGEKDIGEKDIAEKDIAEKDIAEKRREGRES